MAREDQCVLGHHSERVRGTEAVYSYDPSIGAVQRFEVLLHYIATGDFRPDNIRSGFWRFPPACPTAEPNTPSEVKVQESDPEFVCVVECPAPDTSQIGSPSADPADEPPRGLASPEADFSGSSSSSSSSSSAFVGVQVRKKSKPDPILRQAVQDSQGKWVCHSKSGILHLRYGDRMLFCGRAILALFREASEADLGNQICSTCRRHM